MSRKGPKILSLCFADDVMQFAEASRVQAKLVKNCLDRLCHVSGQKVSFLRSSFYFSGNMDSQRVDNICGMLGMSKMDNLGGYLGLPTLHGWLTSETYKSVIKELINTLRVGRASAYHYLVGLSSFSPQYVRFPLM